jgi:Holliday junction resolvasome RuvABC ATP-dependent DNA helicase subunit
MFFRGQPAIMRQLQVYLPMLYEDPTLSMHFFLSGPSGWGKTRLALLCCNFIQPDGMFEISTPVEGRIDFDRNIRVHFVDEVHDLEHPTELYPLLDRGNFVVFFATNEGGSVPEPLINRCTPLTFAPYSEDDLIEIAREYYKFPVSREFLLEIVNAGCSNPRMIISVARRLSMFTKVNGIPQDIVHVIKEVFGIVNGIDTTGQRYLSVLQELGGRASIDTLAAVLHVNRNLLLYQVEPILLHLKKIQITSKGRVFYAV